MAVRVKTICDEMTDGLIGWIRDVRVKPPGPNKSSVNVTRAKPRLVARPALLRQRKRLSADRFDG